MIVNKRLDTIARLQDGYFSAAQAVEAGYGKELQSYHARNGNWLKICRGLFRLPHFSDTLESSFIRWSLWAMGTSKERVVVISHESALQYYGLLDYVPSGTHLTVSSNKRCLVPDGCTLHFEFLELSDYMICRGFCITSPVRTMLTMKPDLLCQHRWEAMLHLALKRELITPAEANRVAGRIVATSPSFTRSVPESQASNDNRTNGDGMRVPIGRLQFEKVGRRGEWRVPPRSFTLVEMLCVIAIITILSALLMPALQNAVESSKKIQCANNQRQIGYAVQMYAQDEYGWAPSGVHPSLCTSFQQYCVNNPTGYYINYTWVALATRYVDNHRLFYCPNNSRFAQAQLNPTTGRLGYFVLMGKKHMYSYGGVEEWAQQSVVGRPIRHAAVVKGGFPILSDIGYTFTSSLVANNTWGGMMPHRNGNICLGENGLYADGHVSWFEWPFLEEAFPNGALIPPRH